MIYLSTARILALRSMSDENLDLIDRPNQVAMDDFEASRVSISGSDGHGGLLGRAAAQAVNPETAERVADLARLHQEFLDAHERVRGFAKEYDYKKAIAVATRDEADASTALDNALESDIADSQAILKAHARTAAHRLRLLPYAIVVAVLAAVAAAAAGIWPRLREYR